MDRRILPYNSRRLERRARTAPYYGHVNLGPALQYLEVTGAYRFQRFLEEIGDEWVWTTPEHGTHDGVLPRGMFDSMARRSCYNDDNHWQRTLPSNHIGGSYGDYRYRMMCADLSDQSQRWVQRVRSWIGRAQARLRAVTIYPHRVNAMLALRNWTPSGTGLITDSAGTGRSR